MMLGEASGLTRRLQLAGASAARFGAAARVVVADKGRMFVLTGRVARS